MADDALHPDLRVPLDRIVPVMRPEEVWLFGSRARGDHVADSDWDLLVVLPDCTPSPWSLVGDAHVAKGGTGIGADIVPTTRSAFLECRDLVGTASFIATREGRRVVPA